MLFGQPASISLLNLFHISWSSNFLEYPIPLSVLCLSSVTKKRTHFSASISQTRALVFLQKKFHYKMPAVSTKKGKYKFQTTPTTTRRRRTAATTTTTTTTTRRRRTAATTTTTTTRRMRTAAATTTTTTRRRRRRRRTTTAQRGGGGGGAQQAPRLLVYYILGCSLGESTSISLLYYFHISK